MIVGLHEPVYDTVKDETKNHLLNKIKVATELAPKINLNELSLVTRKLLNDFNYGYPQVHKIKELPTKRQLEAYKSDLNQFVPLCKPDSRLTTIAAAGLVKNKPNDVAYNFEGTLLKEITSKEYRYKYDKKPEE